MKTKRSFIFQAVCCIAACLWLIGFANAEQFERQDQLPDPCNVESKNQYYEDFLTSYEGINKDQAKAFKAAKKYLACPVGSSDKEEVLANLNLAVGRILISKGSASDAVPYFIKAATFNSPIKTWPQVYADLAEAYLNGPYEKLAAEYSIQFAGQDETLASRLALENILQIVDRVIDAYARAVALAGIEVPPEARRTGLAVRDGRSGPKEWLEALTSFYKFRHKDSAAGLKEFISNVLATPLPPEPTPITSLLSGKKL